MAVPRDELVPVLHDVLPRPQADLFAQPVGVGDRELEPRHDAEHPDGDLRGVQEVRVVLADVERSPVAVTSRRPAHDADRLVYRVPEPCVAVATAPAICWVSMSPWLRSARPASHSGS